MFFEHNYNPALLKLEILTQGIKIDPEVSPLIKGARRVRAGVGSGVDLLLDNEVGVNAPVNEAFCEKSPFTLKKIESKFILFKNEKPIQQVNTFPIPAFYNMKTSDGIPMNRIGVTCCDALLVALDSRCCFWGLYEGEELKEYSGKQCKYCSIGLNIKNTEESRKSIKQILEVWEEARKEKYIRHIELNAGTFPPPGRGHEEYAELVKAVKEHDNNVWFKCTIAPPEDEKYVEILYKANPLIVAYNYEIYDPKIYEEICPGKFNQIDRGKAHAHYDRILKYAVSLYGKQRVTSNLLAGLEPKESTVEGIEHLCSIGVIPRINVFRPLKETLFEHLPNPRIEDIVYIYRKMKNIIEVKYGLHASEPGCAIICVESQYNFGVIPHMPEITDDDLIYAGIDPQKCS